MRTRGFTPVAGQVEHGCAIQCSADGCEQVVMQLAGNEEPTKTGGEVRVASCSCGTETRVRVSKVSER